MSYFVDRDGFAECRAAGEDGHEEQQDAGQGREERAARIFY